MLKVGILASTNGSVLPYLFEAHLEGVEFSCLITNRENCGAQKKARQYKILDRSVKFSGKTREEFDREVVKILQKNDVNLVILIGFMQILTPFFVNSFPNAILNIHPSLLPAFAGGMNNDVHQAVLNKGCKVSGATLHFVSEEVDGGPIALQSAVPITFDETVNSLREKVQAEERKMLIQAIKLFRDKKFIFEGGIVKVKE